MPSRKDPGKGDGKDDKGDKDRPLKPYMYKRCENPSCRETHGIKYDKISKMYLCATCWSLVDPRKGKIPQQGNEAL